MHRQKRKADGAGRVDAQISNAAEYALNDLVNRTGLSKSDVVEAALAFLHESMSNGLIVRSELDVESWQ